MEKRDDRSRALTLPGLAGVVACLKVPESHSQPSVAPSSGKWAASCLGTRASHQLPAVIGCCDKTPWSKRGGRANQKPYFSPYGALATQSANQCR